MDDMTSILRKLSRSKQISSQRYEEMTQLLERIDNQASRKALRQLTNGVRKGPLFTTLPLEQAEVYTLLRVGLDQPKDSPLGPLLGIIDMYSEKIEGKSYPIPDSNEEMIVELDFPLPKRDYPGVLFRPVPKGSSDNQSRLQQYYLIYGIINRPGEIEVIGPTNNANHPLSDITNHMHDLLTRKGFESVQRDNNPCEHYILATGRLF